MRRPMLANRGFEGLLFFLGLFLLSSKQFGLCHYNYTSKYVISNLLKESINHLIHPGSIPEFSGRSPVLNVRRLSSVNRKRRYRFLTVTKVPERLDHEVNFDYSTSALLDFGQPRPVIAASGRKYLAPYNAGNFSARTNSRKTRCGWESAGKVWQERAKKFGMGVYKKETGGGGNCLFYSISAGLRELYYKYGVYQEASMEILRELAAATFVGPALLTDAVKVERNAQAEFLKRLGLLAVLDDGNDWLDSWSPSAILNNNQYRTTRGHIIDTSNVRGKAQAVFEELADTSGAHWGSDFDVGALEDALNVAIVILSAKDGRIYSIAGNPYRSRPYYVLIYYHDQAHFQQAGVGLSPLSAQSAFSREDLPDFVKAVIEEDTKQIF